MPHKPVVLMILDGWGLSDTQAGNAPRLACTPNFDRLMAERPAARLAASGRDVGLPDGQMGNSEVGHTNLGAGRVVWMDLPRIDRAIETGAFAANPALARFAERLRATGGTAHLFGLMSPGGVHCHQAHLAAAANALAGCGVPVALHLALDGRDTPPQSAPGFLARLRAEAAPAFAAGARIASVMGRFFALDRDRRWDRVRAAFAAMTAPGARMRPTAPRPPSPRPMPAAKPTNSSSRPPSPAMAAWPMATGSSASISGPTGHARSFRRCWTRASTASTQRPGRASRRLSQWSPIRIAWPS